MKRLTVLATLFGVTFASVSCVPDALFGVSSSRSFSRGSAVHSIVVGSLTRAYVLHVPARRPVSKTGTALPYALLLVLHGSSATGADMEQVTSMDTLAEVNRWIVAYPNGERGEGGLFPTDWNAGSCCGAAARENIDDVAFVKAVISEIGGKLPVDKQRIYVAGFSDGGRMAHRLACVMAAQIAAIAVVSGSMKDEHCVPTKPVPLIAVHGTGDPTVPYDEESLTPPPRQVTGVGALLPPSVQFWLAVDGCTTGTSATYSAAVTRTSFAGCTGAEVAFYSIANGVHTWPVLDKTASGDPDAQLPASRVIVEFLARQVRR